MIDKLRVNTMHSEEFNARLRDQDDAGINASDHKERWWGYAKYVVLGIAFGVVLVKSEVTSWFRIQEMFRLQSFHMYGIIGSAIAVGAMSIMIIKKWNLKTIHGEPVVITPKVFNKGQIYGGVMFGVGWALTGACPGPLYAQVGAGYAAVWVTIASAIAGTWIYGVLKSRLPH